MLREIERHSDRIIWQYEQVCPYTGKTTQEFVVWILKRHSPGIHMWEREI